MPERNWEEDYGPDLTSEDISYFEDLERLPKPGTRVRLARDVERYPHFIAAAGMKGVVTEATEEVFSVRMDDPLPGSEEWENEVHWYPRNCDEWPFDDIRVIRRIPRARGIAVVVSFLVLAVAAGASAMSSEPTIDCGPEGIPVQGGTACIDREPVVISPD